MVTLAIGSSVTPSPRLRCRFRTSVIRGFSLIELLVAVFVIVLLTGVISLSVGRGGYDLRLEDEVRHLSALISQAVTEAEFTASDHGLLLVRNSEQHKDVYQAVWLRRYDQGWAAPRGGSDVFAPTLLAPGIRLRLALEGQPEIDLPAYDVSLNQEPQVVMFAGGEMTPGALEWLDAEGIQMLYRLEWDMLGRMARLPRGDASVGD